MRSVASYRALVAAVALLGGCHGDFGDALSVSETLENTVAVDGTGSSLSLSNVNGRVLVSTWDRDAIRIEAEKLASSERRLDDIEIEIDESAGDVEVRTRVSKRSLFSSGGKVNYEITVPATADVDVRTVNGKLVIAGVGGRLEAHTVNGAVEVERARGQVVAATVNGSIEASYETLDTGARNEFSTTNGSVRVGFHGDARGEFEVRTVNGRIKSDFDELEASGRFGPRKLSGEIGAGGASFQITTVNGSVKIERRGAANSRASS